jgi:hypothetical protein
MSAVIIAPGEVLKHECGLIFRNIRKEAIKIPNGMCPQCGKPIQVASVGSPVQQTTTLTLIPPHGMSFKNTMGSEVQITMPRGMEMDLFHEMERQLHQWIGQFAGVSRGPAEFDSQRVLAAGRKALATKITVNEEGEILFSDESTEEPKP